MVGLVSRHSTTRSAPQSNFVVSPAAAKVLGAASLGLAAVAALVQIRSVFRGGPDPDRQIQLRRPTTPLTASPEARALHASSALLATSVLADSALEHYRGEFENPGMVAPLFTSLMTAAAGACGAFSKSGRSRFTHGGVYTTAAAVGAVGTGFHLYNILRRPGGFDWSNLFYAAPIGAPAALSLAGLIGLAARRVRDTPAGTRPTLLGLPAGRVLSALTGIGFAGTSGEAGLLHFRGAFQNPFMWLPVTVPPLASALMIAEAAEPAHAKRRWFIRIWLALTAILGVGGVGFHVYGISRQMGGWRNARQNILSGPPLSAPPSFSALALAGFATISLLDQGRESRREPDS